MQDFLTTCSEFYMKKTEEELVARYLFFARQESNFFSSKNLSSPKNIKRPNSAFAFRWCCTRVFVKFFPVD